MGSSRRFDVTTDRRAARCHPRSDRSRMGTRQQGMIAIPRASNPEHVQDNRGPLDIKLTQNDLQLLDQAFPAPTKPVPLETL